MKRLNCINHTSAEFANAVDWADLGQCVRQVTDDIMLLLAASISDAGTMWHGHPDRVRIATTLPAEGGRATTPPNDIPPEEGKPQ